MNCESKSISIIELYIYLIAIIDPYFIKFYINISFMKTPTVVSRGLFLRPLKFKGAFAIQTSFIDERAMAVTVLFSSG